MSPYEARKRKERKPRAKIPRVAKLVCLYPGLSKSESVDVAIALPFPPGLSTLEKDRFITQVLKAADQACFNFDIGLR